MALIKAKNIKSWECWSSDCYLRFHFSTLICSYLKLSWISLHFYNFSGATTIRLEMPSHMQNSLIFHYNLKFYGKETDNYEGISLKRFVMQVII